MSALRLPKLNTGSLMDSLARSNRPFKFDFHHGEGVHGGLATLMPGAVGYIRLVKLRISQVPAEFFLCLCPALRLRSVWLTLL